MTAPQKKNCVTASAAADEAPKDLFGSTKSLEGYPPGTRIRIGTREFTRMNSALLWREEHLVPSEHCKLVGQLLQLEEALGKAHSVVGFYVGQDGYARKFDEPLNGRKTRLVMKDQTFLVEVIAANGQVCHESPYYPTRATLRAAGVIAPLVKTISSMVLP